jgi:putative NADH-flavin reductase
MKLTIIAATGGVGAELLQQAVAAGHDITAVPATRPSCPASYIPSPPT